MFRTMGEKAETELSTRVKVLSRRTGSQDETLRPARRRSSSQQEVSAKPGLRCLFPRIQRTNRSGRPVGYHLFDDTVPSASFDRNRIVT